MNGLFITSKSGNKYYYDDNTGFFNPINKEWNEETYKIKYKDIVEKSLASELVPATEKNIKEYLYDEAQGFRQLILEAASGCNLRCKYCIYSDHYPTYKGYNDKLLSFDTAKKAVDFYMEQYKKVKYINPTRKANIGFYGGEPLLNFKVIKKIVEYINSNYEDKVLYNITTNALLFTEEVQKFFVENDFSIIVSLDGNKENHDRNRVKVDGTGSFDDVMKNLKKFKETYPDYSKIAISACYDYKTDIFKMEDFFDKEKLFIAKLSLVDATNTDYFDQFDKKDIELYLKNNRKFEERFSEVCEKDLVAKDSFLYSYIGLNYSQFAFHSLYNEKRPKILPYTGTCIPGEKIYVTIDGKINICEKINSNYCIGDVDSGLDYNKMIKIINDYNKAIKHNCKNCNVRRFCNICFAQCSTDSSEFKKDFKECKNIEENIKRTMEKYISLLEKNPKLFEDITIDYFGEIYKKVGDVIEL